MPFSIFTAQALGTLASAYPLQCTKLEHRLLHHPLLELDALPALAARLGPASVEYSPGNVPIGFESGNLAASPVGIEDTIRSIAEAGAWVVLKRIEQVPAYADLLRDILAELDGVIRPVTGCPQQCEGFIFITSPGSVTPFHFDPEHNILMQVRGTKTMTVFPDDERLLPSVVQELFHLGKHHRNLPWQEEFATIGDALTIAPGEAIHVPVKAPHWVKNGPDVSISLSVTWRSEWSYAESDARAFNHILRSAGISPSRPASFPARNVAKATAYRLVRKGRQVFSTAS